MSAPVPVPGAVPPSLPAANQLFLDARVDPAVGAPPFNVLHLSPSTVAARSISNPVSARNHHQDPILRNLNLRHDYTGLANPFFATSGVPSRIATAGQITGTEMVGDTACDECKQRWGPFHECIVHPGKVKGACTNCQFSGKPKRCSFRRNNDEDDGSDGKGNPKTPTKKGGGGGKGKGKTPVKKDVGRSDTPKSAAKGMAFRGKRTGKA